MTKRHEPCLNGLMNSTVVRSIHRCVSVGVLALLVVAIVLLANGIGHLHAGNTSASTAQQTAVVANAQKACQSSYSGTNPTVAQQEADTQAFAACMAAAGA